MIRSPHYNFYIQNANVVLLASVEGHRIIQSVVP